MPIRDIFMAIAVPCLWGFGFVIAKAGMEELPPLLINGLRWSLAGIILIWWVPIPKKLFKEILLISFIGCTLQYGLTFSGLNLIDASSAIILVQLEVPFGVLIAFIFLQERPPLKNVFGIIIALIGLIILSGAPNLEGKAAGVFLVISGALVWAIGQVLAKPVSEKINGIALTAWIGILAGPQLILASAILDGNTLEYIKAASPQTFIIVFYMGVIMTAIGYSFWYIVLSKYPVNKIMPIHLLLPFTGVIAAVILLGERPNITVYLGGIIIVIGVAIILFGNSQTKIDS